MPYLLKYHPFADIYLCSNYALNIQLSSYFCIHFHQALSNIRIDSDLGSGSNTLISSHRISRILPRGVRYKGRIHEQPAHNLPIIDAAVTARHDGYMQEQLNTKKGRGAYGSS